MNTRYSGAKISRKGDYVKFIRAAYGRSCAIKNNGQVYIWGNGFKNERIEEPKLIFREEEGILDLQMGLKHGLYIQETTRKLKSWGDSTFGQTGNKTVL